MILWVLSDLHLSDDRLAPMFHEDRQGKSIVELCQRIAAEREGELILLGDVFDLTGMTPPPRGVAAFGRKTGVALDDEPPRSTLEMCRAAQKHHVATLSAIAELAERSTVTLVPGNHDHALSGVDGRAALDAIGLSRVAIEPQVVRHVADRTVVLQHGHELDADNAEPGGDGEMLTRILHRAVVPMLAKMPSRPNVDVEPRRIVSLRPEERVVPVLQRWLEPKRFDAFVAALLDLMVDVGSISRLQAWLATPERLRERLDDADDLWERLGAHARCVLAGERKPMRSAPRPDVLVLGHTHVPDWAVSDQEGEQRLYANLGSWTDRATDAAGPFDRTLPMLRIADDARGLRATLEELDGRRVLQTFDAAHAPGRAATGLP